MKGLAPLYWIVGTIILSAILCALLLEFGESLSPVWLRAAKLLFGWIQIIVGVLGTLLFAIQFCMSWNRLGEASIAGRHVWFIRYVLLFPFAFLSLVMGLEFAELHSFGIIELFLGPDGPLALLIVLAWWFAIWTFR